MSFQDYISQLKENYDHYKGTVQQLINTELNDEETNDKTLLKNKKKAAKKCAGLLEVCGQIEECIKQLESDLKRYGGNPSEAKTIITDYSEAFEKKQKDVTKYISKNYPAKETTPEQTPIINMIANFSLLPTAGAVSKTPSISEFELTQRKKANLPSAPPANTQRTSTEGGSQSPSGAPLTRSHSPSMSSIETGSLLKGADGVKGEAEKKRGSEVREDGRTTQKEAVVNQESTAAYMGGFFGGSAETPTDLQQLEIEIRTCPAIILEKLVVSMVRENPEGAHKILKRMRGYQKQYQELKNRAKKNAEGSTSSYSDGSEAVEELSKINNVIKTAVLQDWLEVKYDNKKWKKRYVVVNDSSIYLFKYPDDLKWVDVISLFGSSVRSKEDGKVLYFGLLTPQRHFKFCAETEKQVGQWTSTIEDICNRIIHETIGTNQMGKDKDKGNTPEKEELFQIMKMEGNNACVDCGAQDPVWVSINLGVFMCIECSGAHRNLGTHISKVRSCQYDLMDFEQLQSLKSVGNIKANVLWEPNVGKDRKPRPDDSLTIKHEYIRVKYTDMAFIEPSQKTAILAMLEEKNKLSQTPSQLNSSSSSAPATPAKDLIQFTDKSPNTSLSSYPIPTATPASTPASTPAPAPASTPSSSASPLTSSSSTVSDKKSPVSSLKPSPTPSASPSPATPRKRELSASKDLNRDAIPASVGKEKEKDVTQNPLFGKQVHRVNSKERMDGSGTGSNRSSVNLSNGSNGSNNSSLPGKDNSYRKTFDATMAELEAVIPKQLAIDEERQLQQQSVQKSPSSTTSTQISNSNSNSSPSISSSSSSTGSSSPAKKESKFRRLTKALKPGSSSNLNEKQ